MPNSSKETEMPQCVQTAVIASADLVIGNDFYYRSQLTECFTKFKLKSIEVKIEDLKGTIYGSVILISENGNKYVLQEDFIFSKPEVKFSDRF